MGLTKLGLTHQPCWLMKPIAVMRLHVDSTRPVARPDCADCWSATGRSPGVTVYLLLANKLSNTMLRSMCA